MEVFWVCYGPDGITGIYSRGKATRTAPKTWTVTSIPGSYFVQARDELEAFKLATEWLEARNGDR